MIAARSGSTSAVTADDQASFLRMLPRIEQHASVRFSAYTAEQREELVAEVVALAWVMFTRLVERRQTQRAFPTPLAAFAVRQVRSGRGLGRRGNVHDVGSRLCGLRKHVHVEA